MIRKYVHLDLESAEKLLRLVLDLRKTRMYQQAHDKCRYCRDNFVLVEQLLAKEIRAVRLSEERAALRGDEE